MTSPISPATGQPVNFQTNVNRAKTKRWLEAKSYAYDGDDWGDGDEYEDEDEEQEPAPLVQSQHAPPPGHPQNPRTAQIASGQRYGDLAYRQVGQPANRSTTNPAMMHNRGQPSFDQGDERRAFSTNVGGFDGPYPTAQRAPFSQSDQLPQPGNHDPRMGPQRGPPPFSGSQQDRRPSMEQDSYPRAPFMPDSRPGPYPDPRNGRYAGQIPQQGRRSQSSGRPSHTDIYGGRESPSRAIPSPLSAVSHGSRDGSPGKSFPPRKSSLSQQTGPPEFIQPRMSQEHSRTDEQVLDSPADARPLPFIRPADIYKRMAEEREKERRASEESSRPSLEDLEPQKRLKPALDPVAERKSEYGLENLTKAAERSQTLPPASNDAEAAKHDGPSGYAPEQSISTQKAPDHEEPPSSTSETEGVQAKPSTNDKQDTGADDVAENTTQELRDDSALQHRPSAGFTSVVHQAFDDSQNRVPPTPSSVSGNSLVRSNSASASDISPIIERAPSDTKERPMSSCTITPSTAQSLPEQESGPLPPPIRPGFRRDSRTPSPGNSPARRPVSVTTADIPREELAILSGNTPTQSKPVRDVPSPVPRAESPMKGTVRDLAGKIENRSPATSSVRSPASVAETPRPASQRLESFRPSLPGGWTSYTTLGTPSPTQGSTPFQSTDDLQREPAAVSTPQEDDMPVAGPPKPVEEGYDVSGTAFQALAGAASALSDAFGTVTETAQDDWPDNETPTEGSTTDATPASERPGGLSPVQEVPSVASDAPPTPPAKDAPYERKTSQLGYFPSPLRTSKSAETPTPIRPQMLPALSTDNSPQDTESDRLRKEIVRSLTPKSPKGQSDLRTEFDPEPNLKPAQIGTSVAAASSSPDSIQASMERPRGEDGKNFDNVADEPANEGTNSTDESGSDEKARNQGTEDIYDLEEVLPEKASYPSRDEDEATEPSVQPSQAPPARPLLQQKFSWEASTEDVETLPEPTETVATTFAPLQGSDSIGSPETIEAPINSNSADIPLRSKTSTDELSGGAKDRPTIIPVADSNEDLRDDLLLPPVAKSLSEPRRSVDMEPDHEPLGTQQSLSAGPAQIPTFGPASEQTHEHAALPVLPTSTGKELSFREILSMDKPQERIRAYNSLRQQLAAQDLGLANWLQATGSLYPEHQQLFNGNGRPLGQQADAVHFHKPSPSRSKFSSFGASLGGANNAQPNDGSKTSFGSPSSSKLTSQQVQEEGKKLLQSAGKLGGKAGGAAKGLFAKGKNKFRASSGGGDKALPSSRHTSQPVINVEDVQRSPATATKAPQISPIFTGVNGNDTWSLSYAPSDAVSRTTTIDKTPLDGRSTTEQPKYANLGPPGYTDEPGDAKNTLKVPPTPSPQISALGSTHLDDIPSRSISEVTSPEVRVSDISPAQPDAQDRASGEEHAEEQVVEPLKSTVNSPPRSRPPSSHIPDDTTPPVDRNESLTLLKRTLDEPPDVDSPGSIYSRRTDDMLLEHKSNDNQTSAENNTPTEDSGLRSQPRPIGLQTQRSMVSAVTPSPGPAVQDQDGLARTITRHSVSPAQQDTEGEKQFPAISPPTQSPPYEDATPPYSAAVESKEAEAAAERSLEPSHGRPQSLPAYQSPIQETAPNLPFQPSAVVPVADLSARRREEIRRPSSRPFSFTNSTNEDILHRHTLSKESQHSSAAASSLSKELGLEINEADLGQHPALRGMVGQPLPSQNKNYTSPHRTTQQKPVSNVSMQQEQQYRIPGPYGQQFRSPKPIATSLDVEKTQLQRPPNSAPLVGREKAGSDPTMTHHRHRSSAADVVPRLSTTDYTSPGVGSPQESSKSTTKPRSAAARLFRPRSRSRSRLSNDDDTDQYSSHQQEDGKREGRGGIFWSHSRQDNESTSGRPDSTRANSGGSYRGLNFQQQSASVKNSEAIPNEKKTKIKGQKFTKKLHNIATSSNQTETENKKKGGFLRLSGLFAKSGKQSPPPLVQRHPVERATTMQPISNPPPIRASERAFSVPHQQQIGRRSQDPPRDYNNQRPDSFQGQAPPVGGYYAPGNPTTESVQHPAGPLRDPEAFIGGRRLSDQRLADQARALKNVPNQAENQFLLSPPQHSPKVLPHSAPPSSQHFDPNQIQQPRATSQRFPPDLNLRIDTSGHLGPNRRSQPVPLVGTTIANQDSSRARVSAPGQSTTIANTTTIANATTTNNNNKNKTNNILTHTTSNPQRTSPYTVNTTRTSPHSPHGYGTARGLRKDNLSHAIDLHKRSRSPRNGRRDSVDSPEELINVQDPANKLGTFASKKPHRGGDGGDGEEDGQEKPWKIDLPLDDDDEKPRTAAEKVMAGRVPLGSGSAARNSKNVKVAELPGSKAPAEESSDEEIIMSSTAYPGQEWMPEMYGYGYGDE